jgi:hypothetical protein
VTVAGAQGIGAAAGTAASSPTVSCAASLDEVVAATARAVNSLAFQSARGPLHRLLPTFSAINYGLTLRPLVDQRLQDNVVAKNVYVLWNITVDDAIDRQGSLRELDQSWRALLGEDAASSIGVAGGLLRRLLAQAGGFDGDSTPLIVALTEIMAAMRFEHACRDHPALAGAERLVRHSVTTLGLEVHLAIDLLAARPVLDDARVRLTSRVYRELSAAMRYASDVGGLQRERDEGALNSLTAWHLDNPDADADALRRRGERRAQAHLSRARRIAASADVPGLADVIRTVTTMVRAFASGDPFGDPSRLLSLPSEWQAATELGASRQFPPNR